MNRLHSLLRRTGAAVPCVSAAAYGAASGHAETANSVPFAEGISGGLTRADVVGGHEGMLKDVSQLQVLKPLLGKRGQAEAQFYRFAFDRKRRHMAPAVFMPQFFGVSTLYSEPGTSEQSFPYIALEDVTATFKRPSVIDIKIGTQTWDEEATPEKIARDQEKYPPQQSLGFRVTGMRVWDVVTQQYREHGREFGYSLDEGSMSRAFDHFFWDGARLKRDVAQATLQRLDELEEYFKSQASFRFYGSSILVIYEGDAAVGAEADAAAAAREAALARYVPHSRHGVRVPVPNAEDPPTRVDVRMIDFAHVWPIRDGPDARDDGYLLGLRSVRAYIQQSIRDADDADSGTGSFVREHVLAKP